MDYVATQPSSLPLHHNKAYTAEEYDDVLCILQPASQSAITICQNIWKTTPNFILQYSNAGLRADGTVQEGEDVDLEMIGGEDTQGARSPTKTKTPIAPQPAQFPHPDNIEQHLPQDQDNTPRTELVEETQLIQPANLDIALRTSSIVKDYASGFVFGRDLKLSDIKLATGGRGDGRISGSHFRIHLNQYGILMLEDSSTNGTIVDDEHLGRNTRNRSKILQHGSTIEVVANSDKATQLIEKAIFIVKLPERNDTRYKENLEVYVSKIARSKRDREQVADGSLFPKPSGHKHGHGTSNVLSNTSHLSAGTERNTLAGGWTANGKYKVIGEIGKGAFAMVYRVSSTVGGIVRAAKQIDRAAFMKNGVVDGKFLNELVIMQKVDHPHIVDFVDYDLTAKYLYIIMEYISFGDLAPYAFQKTFLGISTLKSVTRQLLHALAYIHRNGIVHRDIKPENILVFDKDPFSVKLTDFGLSKMIGEETPVMVTFCGTLLYCAPEIYPDYEPMRAGLPRVKKKSSATKPYSSAVDIWSLGTVMYHLLASKPPFKGTGEDQGYKMLRAVMFDDIDYKPLYDRGVDSNGVAFLNSMIDVDGESRPSAIELLIHPWMQDVPDIIHIPNLEESQIINHPGSEGLETLEEEDEWDKLESDSFLKAAGALLKTPTPDAPSLSNGETSAEDKVPITENNNSAESSPVEVASANSPRISADRIKQGNEEWQLENAIGSVPADRTWLKKGWPDYYSQDRSMNESISGSEDDTFQQPKPGKLFGEISQDPNGESGIFGADSQPTIRPRNDSIQFPPNNSPSLFGTESRMNNLNMKASRYPNSVLKSAINNSIIHGKRHRSVATSGSDESNTSSIEEPAAKRSMIALGEPIEFKENVLPDKKAISPDVTNALSQQIDEMQVSGTRLATLSPISGGRSSEDIVLTTRLSTFGRRSSNTNVYEREKPEGLRDTYVPTHAFDIYFLSPGIEHLRDKAWYKDPDLYAVIMTRRNRGIKVNGVHLIPHPGKAFRVARLRTGDLIEVRKELVYRCMFHVSESRFTRGADEDVIVEDNAEMFEAASKSTNSTVAAVAASTAITDEKMNGQRDRSVS